MIARARANDRRRACPSPGINRPPLTDRRELDILRCSLLWRQARAGCRFQGCLAPMVGRTALVLLLLLALGGCATPPGSTADPASTDAAELVLSRPGDRTHRNVTAVVEVNGVRAVELEREEGFTAPLRPGPTVVSVSGAPHPGHYSVSFNAEAGKSYNSRSRPAGEIMNHRRWRWGATTRRLRTRAPSRSFQSRHPLVLVNG